MHLHAERCDFDTDVARKCLGERRQQRGARVRRRPRRLVGPALGAIERQGGHVADAACGLGQGPHGHEHALDVGMRDDRRRLFGRHAGNPALAAFARIGDRLLRGTFGNADALQADGEAGAVHHREHASHARILFADKVADRAAIIAEHHRAGRRTMDAELVLDRMRAHVVARARSAVLVEQEFGHEEQRNAARAGQAHRAVAPVRDG